MRVLLVPPDRGLPDDVRDAMERAVAGAGHELLPPLPEWRAGIAASERDRFLTTVDRMMEADLLLVDASEESASVGWCVAWFLARGRLVVLACRRGARASLSPMLAGNPSPWARLVPYDDAAGLHAALAGTLAF